MLREVLHSPPPHGTGIPLKRTGHAKSAVYHNPEPLQVAEENGVALNHKT
jgi:hypothetical protein